jgi:uncharacterized iron-regulated membrane protein
MSTACDSESLSQPFGSMATSTSTSTSFDSETSRRWRSIWRLHFYAGVLSAPFLVLFALTGLVILYTQPIDRALSAELYNVEPFQPPLTYEELGTYALDGAPGTSVRSMTLPADDRSSVTFGLSDGRQVFVDQYSGEVLGSRTEGRGIIGLANRLHGSLGVSGFSVPIPTLSGVFGDDPLTTQVPLSEVILEVVACWGLVLAASGIYLWWPRRRGVGKALVRPRTSKRGRARWRDLHAVPGFVLSFILAFFVVSGMPWSAWWGTNFATVAEYLTPGTSNERPMSSGVALGDADRFGNQINWALQDELIPMSDAAAASDQHAGHESETDTGAAPDTSTDGPIGAEIGRRMALDNVVAIGREEGMKPGFTIALPENAPREDGSMMFGSYVLTNPWPGRTQDAVSIYLNQFTGDEISRSAVGGAGAISVATDYAVSTHMGTQFGLASRIVMTAGCVLVIWSVISAVVMYVKRRRPGSVGLPRRPAELKLAHQLTSIAVVLGVIYPLWGLSALGVLAIDRWIIRRLPRLRTLFGQRPARLGS